MKKAQVIIIVVAMLLPLLLGACGTKPAATEIAPAPKTVTPAVTATPTPKTVTPAVTAKPAWQEDWERTLAAAKKEGTVVVYTGFGADFRIAFTTAMKEKFGIDAEFMTGRSAEIAERIMSEQRSKTYAADVVIIGVSQHQLSLWPAKVQKPLKPVIILPEVLDPNAWWEGRVPWVDREAATVLQFIAMVNVPFAINTNLVKPDELKSHWDLSKWKGKIIMDDATVSGPGQQMMTMIGHFTMGWDYVEWVAKLEPVLLRDRTQQLQWLGLGKYAVLLCSEPDTLTAFKKTGAPVKLVTPVEGAHVTPGFGTVALLKGAPHPNAAKVFINFLLTKEGQTLTSRAQVCQSARVDVPIDHLDPDQLRLPGFKYASTTDEKFLAVEVEAKKKVTDIFKPLLK